MIATRNASFAEFNAEALTIGMILSRLFTVPRVSSRFANPVEAVVSPSVSIQLFI